MQQIVECVPNFSEGRRAEVIDAICAAITAVPGARLIDREMDADHNRAVVTLIGEPEACAAAAVAACAKAAEMIDLNSHQGEHPRMGATDVIPFVPVRGVTMDDCVRLARRTAREISERLAIPTFLYEYAASDPCRQDLSRVRGKGFEEMRGVIGTRPEKTPDFGPRQVHASAGSTAVGARDFLIAYNIYLDTNNIEVARNIARGIRASSGGFMFCKAAGFEIKDRGCVQVSMNLTNPAKTPMFRVFEAVKREAARYGARVTSSEVVGLAPLSAISDVAEYYLQIERWRQSQIIEAAVLEGAGETSKSQNVETSNSGRQGRGTGNEQLATGIGDSAAAGFGAFTMTRFLSDLASRAPTPGGGSASAYAGALGAALVAMVGRLNDKKDGTPGALHHRIAVVEEHMERLNRLVTEDARAFDEVAAAWKLPDTDPTKARVKEAAQVLATRTPLETMAVCVEIMKLAIEGLEKSKKSCLSDAGVAALLAHAALEGARLNVMINLPEIRDEATRGSLREEAERHRAEAGALYAEARRMLEANYS